MRKSVEIESRKNFPLQFNDFCYLAICYYLIYALLLLFNGIIVDFTILYWQLRCKYNNVKSTIYVLQCIKKV